MDTTNKLIVWARLPRLPVRCKDENINKVIAQPSGDIIKVNEIRLGLNGVLFKVLLEVDLHFPLKRVIFINKDDDYPILVGYEKLFEVCFYYGRRMFDGYECPKNEVDDDCFLIKRVFKDEPLIYPEDTRVDEDANGALHDDVKLWFPFAVTHDDEAVDGEKVGQKVGGSIKRKMGRL